jgi:hypothetical protein
MKSPPRFADQPAGGTRAARLVSGRACGAGGRRQEHRLSGRGRAALAHGKCSRGAPPRDRAEGSRLFFDEAGAAAGIAR